MRRGRRGSVEASQYRHFGHSGTRSAKRLAAQGDFRPTTVTQSSLSAVTPCLQLEAEVARSGSTDGGMQAIRRGVLTWAEKSVFGAGSRAKVREEPCTFVEENGRRFDAMLDDERSAWACRLVVPDRQSAGRQWIAETVLLEETHQVRLAMRLSCAGESDGSPIEPFVPGIMLDLVRDFDLRSRDEKLTSTRMDVTDRESLEHLVGLIESDRRVMPVVVISATRNPGAAYIVDADELAKRLVGLAWVYRLSYEQAFALTDRFGKQWSVFDGACRIYWTGLDRGRQTPFEHKLIFGSRLRNNLAVEFEQLVRDVANASAARDDIFIQFAGFSDLQTIQVRPHAGRVGPPEAVAPARPPDR